MIQSIKKSIVVLLLVTAFTSCNQEPTLQTYFVDHELEPGFATFDVPKSFVNVENITLTDTQEEAYNSVDKLNVLTFSIDNTEDEAYKLELNKVKTILKDPKYDELMRGGNAKDGKFVIKFLGEVDAIDELVLFGNANNKGFIVARVLGDEMNAKKLMALRSVLDKASFEEEQLKGLTEFFK
ncbi:DUF4252 domain-containing protein [Winogradskyella rapida]|uniref:DUF4252 domain-containing protein n=1 Tax=Winogradskyella rapida TaxID=549701 RepID=A0ABW3KMM7_9FLAO